jgi:hypothetical protein
VIKGSKSDAEDFQILQGDLIGDLGWRGQDVETVK